MWEWLCHHQSTGFLHDTVCVHFSDVGAILPHLHHADKLSLWSLYESWTSLNSHYPLALIGWLGLSLPLGSCQACAATNSPLVKENDGERLSSCLASSLPHPPWSTHWHFVGSSGRESKEGGVLLYFWFQCRVEDLKLEQDWTSWGFQLVLFFSRMCYLWFYIFCGVVAVLQDPHILTVLCQTGKLVLCKQ